MVFTSCGQKNTMKVKNQEWAVVLVACIGIVQCQIVGVPGSTQTQFYLDRYSDCNGQPREVGQSTTMILGVSTEPQGQPVTSCTITLNTENVREPYKFRLNILSARIDNPGTYFYIYDGQYNGRILWTFSKNQPKPADLQFVFTTGQMVTFKMSRGELERNYDIRIVAEPVRGEPTPITEFKNVEDRATDNSLTLQWRTGYDGGINQSFQLKYRQKGTDIWSIVILPHNTNATNAIMDYTINGLASGTRFEVILYSSNTYGNSELTQIIEAMTTEHVCITKDSHAAIVGAAVGGMLGGALVVCCIVAAVVFFQRLRKKKEKESSRKQNSPTHIITNTYMELRQGQEFTSPTSDYSTLDLSGDTRGITTADDGKHVNMDVGKN